MTLRKPNDINKEDTLKVAVLDNDAWTEGTGGSDGNKDGGITWNTKPSGVISENAVKISESYNLGDASTDKPKSDFAVNGTRVNVDITDIVETALEDENKTNLSLIVNEANGLEHYFVSKEGALGTVGDDSWTSAWFFTEAV